ncbi:MAG: nucleoside 2-deoxyribosyltransferase domain-containing protein [Bacteroidales bacterium]|nr:nucleoside 2-deoxyribosyltransferase domain-containing protein [Candidatus Latescibacterota bacterium]
MAHTVYLAGGMRTGWQDQVINAAPDLDYKDPRTHGLRKEKEYTEWDLNAIDESTIMFAFLEADNPSGAGLALEIGYAKAQGKYIIFVCEAQHPHYRYFGMSRMCANRVYDYLEDGVEFLRTFQTFPRDASDPDNYYGRSRD